MAHVNMLPVVLFSVLVCSSAANERDVMDSWTRLRISRETVSDFDFQGIRISLYNDSGNSRRSDPSTHKYYFSPMARLDHHSAKSIFNKFTKEAQMQFTIEMWGEDLRNESFYHLKEEENLSQLKLSRIAVLPLERVVLTSPSPLAGEYALPRSWASYRSTKSLKFYFTCDSIESCDELRDAMKSSPEQFTDLTLKFSLESEGAKSRESTIRIANVREGDLFAKLDHRFPYADSVLVTAEDRKKMLSETSQRILVETFDNDEVFGSSAQQSITKVLESLMFSGKEILDKQSSAIWESVFWEKDNYRPDKTVNTMNELYKNSAKEAQEKLRQLFSSSASNSVDIKDLVKEIHSSTSRGSGSNYSLNDTSRGSHQGGHGSIGFGLFSASGGYSQSNQDRTAKAASNSFTSDQQKTHDKHVEKADARSISFSRTEETNKDELLKLLEEGRQNIKWSGERFVIKPMELSRVNLAKIRSGQDFTDRATSVRYWTAILSTQVHVDEGYTPSLLNQVQVELQQIKRKISEQMATTRQDRQELTQQVADVGEKVIALNAGLKAQLQTKLDLMSERLREITSDFDSKLKNLRLELLDTLGKNLTSLEKAVQGLQLPLSLAGKRAEEKQELLFKAAENGNVTLVRALILVGAEVNSKDKYGRTPLHLAAEYGHADAIKAFLKTNADVNAKYNGGRTSLHLAAEYGHADAIKALLKSNADVNAKYNGGRTPLHLAAEYGHADALKALLKSNADVNAKNNGWTPLHWAARNGHADAIKALLNSSADVNAKEKDGWTPLHLAAENGHADAIKALLNSSADVSAKKNDGWMPLHLAARNGHADAVKALLNSSADVNAKENDGWTPLHFAAYWGQRLPVEALLQAGANKLAKNIQSRTPKDLAVLYGQSHVLDLL